MLKNEAEDSLATARASIVLPLPGGPKRSSPRDGERNPVNNSGLSEGRMTISCNACFANCNDNNKNVKQNIQTLITFIALTFIEFSNLCKFIEFIIFSPSRLATLAA